MHKHVFMGLVSLTLLAACSQAPRSAQGGAQLPQGANAPLNLAALGKNAQLFDKSSKLDSQLITLSNAGLSAQAVKANPKLGISGGLATVDAVPTGEPEALLAKLQALGLKNGSVYEGMVSGRLPTSALGQAGGLAELRNLRLSGHVTEAYSTPSQGLTVSEGDKAQASDVARQKYRVSGKGFKVGALSDSFNCVKDGLTTADQDIANGDLPASGVQVIADLAEPDCSASGTDEGRGMLQIVHDVAPSAKLAFATAYDGEAGFANNIERLAIANSDIITDDVRYFFEPMFQDGVVAQAVNDVTKDISGYFSSSGNYARQSYESAFRPSGATFGGCQLNDFDPGAGVDTLQSITLAPGADTLLVLQWDQPFASVSRHGKGSASDVDLLLFDDAGNLLPTDAATGQFPVSADNNVNADPVEAVQYFNTGTTPLKINVVVSLCSGPQPGILKWVDYGSAANVEYATNSSTNYGHSNSAGGVGVGAARFYRTPAFGQNPPLLESFSSAGGTPILFNKNGNRISADLRQQPRFTAPDGGNTSFFGQLKFGSGAPIPFSDDQFPNFFGTSAAAPHAAGVAALMLEATDLYGGKQTAPAIYKAMSLSALDMKTPGFDFDSGYGLIQADKAIAAIIKKAP